jgi:hypothetical protein
MMKTSLPAGSSLAGRRGFSFSFDLAPPSGGRVP